MFNNLCKLFKESNELFLKNEKELILSGVSERSLCGKLAVYLDRIISNSDFNEYFVDIEYNRNFNGSIKTIINDNLEVLSITCDIIVHSRGHIKKQDNLIAIEMKKSSGRESDKQKDKERLIALTKSTFDDVWSNDGKTLPKHVCGYVLGIYYEINIDNGDILLELYESGKLYKIYNGNINVL